MKKIITVCFIIFLGVIGFFIGKNHVQFAAPKQQGAIVQQTSPSIQPSIVQQQSIVGLPKRLIIQKIGVTAKVESVGLDAEEKMDIPKNVQNVAWYNLGVKPGELGNAVIDGHYDTATGAPAVFYSITKLKSGDILKVTDENDKEYIFSITRTQTYDFDKIPISEIFGPSAIARLNLITCGGVWDKKNKNYLKRIVVYSEIAK